MKLIEHFFRLLAPDECLGCTAEGSLLCETCKGIHLEAVPPRCFRCFRITKQSRTCPGCRQHSRLSYVWVCSTYNNTAKKLVHLLKFNFTRSAAALMAAEMSKIMPRLPAHTIIVHVSAVSSHIRQRGFDQSALIARELSYLLSLPHMHVLGRLGQKRQVGASRSTREEQLKDAFRPLSLPTIQGAHVLLVDDVLTTGSTLEEAARTLREAGATSVSAVVFAQAK